MTPTDSPAIAFSPLPAEPDPAALSPLEAGGATCRRIDLARLLPAAVLDRLPRTLRILFENAALHAPDRLAAVVGANGTIDRSRELDFFPSRVLMHDTTCLPALADFAAMRDAVAALGGDPARVNPVIPVDLVIDHSVTVEHYGSADAARLNLEVDFGRNAERYRFVKWAQQSLRNFRVMPPGSGILHQINLEFLAEVVRVSAMPGQGAPLAWPDTLVGTDSHTPMVNALGVLAWGVGGVEGQAAMLGEPLSMQVPKVVGVRLEGSLAPGVTATDLALHVTSMLRAHGVLGCFVEFCGPGVGALSVADRATVANMAPEYGATCSFFPIDLATLDYLRASGRGEARVALVEAHARAQGTWQDADDADPRFEETLVLDLATIEPIMAGPRYPHERRPLGSVRADFLQALPALAPAPRDASSPPLPQAGQPRTFMPADGGPLLRDGAVVLAAITSCTNTSNPALLVGAGLLARNARRLGLGRKPWVKTSLSPGSRVVAGYLSASGLQDDLDALGFNVVGLGCMTCIGNSGQLEPVVVDAVERQGLCAVGVLSGNRNFDGRVNGHLAGAYLASPPLVVAYAIAGTVDIDLAQDPLAEGADGRPVRLADLWPSEAEIRSVIEGHLLPEVFAAAYQGITDGPAAWQAIDAPASTCFAWEPASDYIRRPPYFEGLPADAPGLRPVRDARLLLKLGDDITTDHISPAGTIPAASAAGRYLLARGTVQQDLNQYSTRRSNHEVLLRGAFSNRRLRNEVLSAETTPAGGHAFDLTGSRVLPVYEASAAYREAGVPLVILAGRNYGAGSSRDWAAKAPALLGVRIVVAESFERIHRSNLLALGVLPLLFDAGCTRHDLCRDGRETFSFDGLDALAVGRNRIEVEVTRPGGSRSTHVLWCTLESSRELGWLQHGGVLPRMVRRFARARTH